MLINLTSYLYFYKALKRLFEDALSPYIVILLLLSFWPYQSWSLYLYTECFFYSIVLILFSHLILFERLGRRFLLTTFLLLFLVIISRPLGILFLLPTLLFIFFKLSGKQRLFLAGAIVLFFMVLNYVVQVVFTTTPDWNMTRALTEESIICDMPRNITGLQLDLSQSHNQLYRLFYYVTHNFAHFFELALERLKYFFLLVRNYYSFSHNLYLVVYLIVIYGSIIWGIKKIVKSMPVSLSVFIFSSIILFAIVVALQCDDYHNRFFLTLMPFFMTMAATAFLPPICKAVFSLKSHKD